jgi:hypothetical protein
VSDPMRKVPAHGASGDEGPTRVERQSQTVPSDASAVHGESAGPREGEASQPHSRVPEAVPAA